MYFWGSAWIQFSVCDPAVVVKSVWVAPVASTTTTRAAETFVVDQLKVSEHVPPGTVTVQGFGVALIVPDGGAGCAATTNATGAEWDNPPPCAWMVTIA